MDNVNLLTSTDADGGLPASPPIRFNKEGILLAVSTNDNGIKILANSYGIRLLRTVDTSRAASVAVVKASAIGTFGSSNITVGTGIGDRVTPMPAMVGLINGILLLQNVESTSIKHNRRACDCCKNKFCSVLRLNCSDKPWRSSFFRRRKQRIQ